MSLTDGLNNAQKDAVLECDNPLLILAGAGSGKTRVITVKIAHLIKDLGYSPNSILSVTFTKKASAEMKERIIHMIPNELTEKRPFMGTFHSFGALLLRRHADKLGLERSFTIYDQDDQLSVVKSICKDMQISQNFKPRLIHGKISDAKNKGISASDYYSNSYGDDFDEIVSKVYKEYTRRLKAQNAVDFDDLLSLVVKLFEEHPEVLSIYQERYKYVLVDEYQDTNMEQYRIVRALTKKHRHLCVVGDEDQSIYSWRGATADNIRFFQKDYPDHKLVKLEQNYRSTEVILNAANHIISKNPNRIPKKLWTEKKGNNLITVSRLNDAFGEAINIIRELQKYHNDLNEVAVLYRINSLSRSIEEAFVRYGVPYKLVGGVGFYHRMEVKDIMAYLKFISNPKDEVSLLRIINIPSRKIGSAAIRKFRGYAKESKLSLSEYIWYVSIIASDLEFAQEHISKEFLITVQVTSEDIRVKFPQLFAALGELIQLSFAKTTDISSYIQNIIERISYKAWIQKMSSTKDELTSRLGNIQELSAVAQRTTYQGREGLTAFLEDVALVEEAKEVEDEETNANIKGKVHLMTIHAAKGLEFKTIFLVGLEEGTFPHGRSLKDPIQLQEERRLFYVAVTRAKENLYISSACRRQINGVFIDTTESQYIADIPHNLKVEK